MQDGDYRSGCGPGHRGDYPCAACARRGAPRRDVKVTPMNELARTFLEIYAAGGEPAGGWTYGKALRQARLDFTPDSLKRLDALLAQIRERARPSRADLDTVSGRNFESLVVFYVIELARRRSQAVLDWHEGAAAPALPSGAPWVDAPGTRLLVDAPLHGLRFEPLAWLEGQLLAGGQALAAADYVATVVAQLERHGPPRWWTAMQAVGRLGSWQMMMAAGGRGIWPTLVSAAAPTTPRTMDGGDLRLAVQQGDHLLSNNPEGQPWQVFSYAGYAERKGARVDAVVLLAATYGDQPMRLRIGFPFRPAQAGEPLRIWQPVLVDGNLDVETSARLGPALEYGIRSLKWSSGGWDELYQA